MNLMHIPKMKFPVSKTEGAFGLLLNLPLTLQKYLVQKRFARSISGDQENDCPFSRPRRMLNTLSSLKMVNPAFSGTDPIYTVLNSNFMQR